MTGLSAQSAGFFLNGGSVSANLDAETPGTAESTMKLVSNPHACGFSRKRYFAGMWHFCKKVEFSQNECRNEVFQSRPLSPSPNHFGYTVLSALADNISDFPASSKGVQTCGCTAGGRGQRDVCGTPVPRHPGANRALFSLVTFS